MNPGLWCIKNNRTTAVLLLLLVLSGIFTFKNISRLEDPEFTIRCATVITSFPGASPQRVEELITDKIEKKLREMPEVEDVLSQSMTGLSIIFVQVAEKYKNMAPIWNDLRNKVDDIKSGLPEGSYPPAINESFGDVFGIVISITGDGYTYREMKDVAEDVRDKFLKIDSVAKVDFYGTQKEQIFVDFSTAKLAEYGISPYQLSQMLQAQNTIQSGGEALLQPERIVIEATGEFKSIDELKRATIRIPGQSGLLYLEDIATVKRSFVDPPTTMTRFNGKPSITMAISMASGGNIVKLGKLITDEMEKIESGLPVGLDFNMLVYQPKYVDKSINEFMVNLLEAFALVIIVMLLFAGLRTGLITGLLVPMAMLMCIILMPLFGVVLQRVSIASLIIALGMLVDNGVVVSESILVRLAEGEERLKAVGDTVKELWLPLLIASLTTICAFLPIATAKSAIGEYCISLFIVISLTLLSSWVLSITMMPLLCYYFLKPRRMAQNFKGRFYRFYRSFLIFNLKRRSMFIIAVVALLLLSLWGFRFIPNIFFPPNSRDMFMVDFWQPYSTDIRITQQRAKKLESFLMNQKEVVSVGTFTGSGGPRWYLGLNPEQDNSNYAFLLINTKNNSAVPGLMRKTRTFLSKIFPDCQYTIKELESGTPVGAPIQIRLSGKDISTIYELRNKIFNAISVIPGISNVRDDWGEWTKKIVVNVNQDQAKRAGITSQDIALSLQTQMTGLNATEFREGKEAIPIIIRSGEAYRQDLGKLGSMNVYSYSNGANVPLLHVAKENLTWQPSNILRRNQTRTMVIKTNIIGRTASEVLNEVIPKVNALKASQDWIAGYEIEYGGEFEESAKAQKSIIDGLPLALGLIIILLISQFNSIRRSIIIALTIPGMIIGITPGLLITNAPFGFMAMLGMISLMGIIVNNAIMMIDRIEIERGLGQRIEDSIIIAAQHRFRPILMTTITTILGLIPLSLQGGEMWRPMANVIIFGLAFSTILTLVLCPVLYSLFFGSNFKEYKWTPKILVKDKKA
ncbi:MAG: efflux RND transporter permease subunit [Candidatus Theseobacter exili]|nr:efflux RND transporter permease subunit [Candidatus Theseobacter exili]